jgi:uncharacterized protein YjdB
MKTRIFLFAASLCCFFLTQSLDAQVTSVNYQVKYDTSECRYDAYIIINSGSATTVGQRTQASAQFSLVIPTGRTISIVESHNPLSALDNVTPINWGITTTVDAPTVDPGNKYVSITVPLSPTSRYNAADVQSGDTVKIFSFVVSDNLQCGEGIRIYENGSDPDSSEPGMGGSDFSNGFTMGGINQLYNANSTQINPPKPVIVSAVTTCSAGIEIDLTASTSACQTPLTYAWTGPNSYVSTTQDVSIIPSTLLNVGDYKVIVTDSLGCRDSITITATNKPSAGADQTACAGTIVNLAGTDPTTGTWAVVAGNPTGGTLNPGSGGTATVSFTNAAVGTYRYAYSTTSCGDTMSILVSARPTVSISGSNNICIGSTTSLSPNSGGKWVSNAPLIASVDSISGVVTGLAQGSATFTFTSTATGCSATTPAVTVNPKPTVTVSGTPEVCIGSTTTLTPTTGGNWVPVFPAIATVTNAGLVTGVSAGTGSFVFTETSTGCISDPLDIDVTPAPTITDGADSICVLTTTQLLPSSGGTWSTSNSSVAVINNSGIVTGLTPGSATFIWTETTTGCSSAPSAPVVVVARPVVSLSAPVICAGGTANAIVTPSVTGKWISNNLGVATIDSTTGLITAVAQGSVSFTFTNRATGCSSTTSLLNINPRPTIIAPNTNVCIGSTINVSASSGGTWTSLNPGFATVTLGGVVTGVAFGVATLQFTETGTLCTNTVNISVVDRPTVTNGAPSICVGFTTQLTPTTGGTWQSSNGGIATVANNGLVTGVGVGMVTFTFTSTLTGCTSAPTAPITVINKPTVSITGANLICIGATTQLSPTTGGTWASSNDLVATVTDAGVVTAQGAGTATFIFTATGGCASNPTAPVTVSNRPNVNFTGPSIICVGLTTTVAPATGGTWISSNPLVATITNAGLVSGIAQGTATLTFTETTTGCTSLPLTVTVSPKPTSSVDGPSSICIGANTQLLPDTLGTWISNNNSIATITNEGLVTGVAQGTAIFTFTSTAGCASDPITSIAIMPRPTVNITGPADICIGTTTTLSPTSGGTWTSSDISFATVTNGGIVTGVAEGVVTFTFLSDVGCASLETAPITVNPRPVTVVNGPSSICVGSTTTISPSLGGTWTSTNNAIATIANNGTITGVSSGDVRFIFTNTTTGCVSDTSSVVTITPGPTVNLGLDTLLCIGENTTLSPTTGGTWTSSNNSVATISNAALVTAVAQGTVTFRFRLTATGCLSEPTSPITVSGRPTVSITSNNVCIGGTTQLSPSTGGTWASSNNAIATVTDGGVVTGVSEGTATFIFTLTGGCPSLPTEPIQVNPAPIATISGPTIVCIGGTTTLLPNTGGTWSSSDPSIAIVTNTGIVTGIAPGTVNFTFVETASGCASSSATPNLTITQCFNPDFNATFVNVEVPGDVSTNDIVSVGTTYGPTPVPISNPSGSIYDIDINSGGTYTFVANLPGVYVFNVPVCVPPLVSGCPTAELTITVADHLNPTPRPFAHVDFATTPVNQSVVLISLANDGCAVVTGCSLDATSVTITSNPSHGGAVANGTTGDITYTPNNNYIGTDTLTYEVCVSGGNCATAKQVITINSPAAGNTTVAADDFAVTAQSEPVSGNVQTNDTDPEGDTQTITAQSITVAEGELELESDGSFTFTPADNFTGPVEFIYETIDANASPDTAYATLHILVVPDLVIKVRMYLEGALMNNANAIASDGTGRPLMRDNLRSSPFTAARYIPDSDPYRTATTYINVLSKFTKVAPGDRAEFLNIPDPTTVFGVTGQNAIVDWVFIELRSKTTNTTVLATRSGLLQRDGDVVDLDGINGLRFPGIAMDNYYVVVRHLRHLGTMTKVAQTPAQLTTLVNFTTTALETYDKGIQNPGPTERNYTGMGQKAGVKLGYMALWAGDFDSNRKIKFEQPNDDLNSLFFNVFTFPNNPTGNVNYDFAIGYLPGDFDMNSKAKFDNPNDDKNMLYLQVLFYPLNAPAYLSNYDFLIEQLP